MVIDKLEINEKKFDTTLIDSLNRKFLLLETINIDSQIIKKLKSPSNGFYIKEKTQKNMIVIHSTVGELHNDISTLTIENNPVSVSYIIGRNGIIYELFPPEYWSYHLGKDAISGNKINSSRSIGIELSNFGPLNLYENNLETVYSRQKTVDKNGKQIITPKHIYCTLNNTEFYTKLDKPFRDKIYFATFTQNQYKALNILIKYLCDKFNIPKIFQITPEPFKENIAKNFNGICSHVNYRSSGKWDVGPDFKWELIYK